MKKTIATMLAFLLLSLPCWAALEFDGVNQYVSIASLPDFSNVTVMIWFHADDTVSTQFLYRSREPDGLHDSLGFVLSDNGLSTYWRTDGSTVQTYVAFSDISYSHHVAEIRNGTAVTGYLDGIYESDFDGIVGAGTIQDLRGNWLGINFDETYPFNGKEWDFRLYNRALSPAEIRTIYSAKGNDNIVDGLVDWWRMDEKPDGQTAGAGDVIDIIGDNDGDGTNAPIYRPAPVAIIKPIQGG